MKEVTEKDLQGVFKALVDDLSDKLKSGEATGKDKELALKLVENFKVGVTLADAAPLEELNLDLPFSEMRQ